MTFQEKLQAVFDKYGTTELKVHMLLNLYDDVLDCYAEDQKQRKQKLQERYDKAMAEPSDEMDKLDNLQKLIEELLRSKI